MGNTRYKVGKRYLIGGDQKATAIAETDKFPEHAMGFMLDEQEGGNIYAQDRDGLYYFNDEAFIEPIEDNN